MAYLKPQAKCQRDLFLDVLGNQSSHFDQPVLAYKHWCRDILYNISGLKLMQKYSTIYTKNNMKGLVGGPLLVGGLGPGPPRPPLNPALRGAHAPVPVAP